jgi:hypothetical protein
MNHLILRVLFGLCAVWSVAIMVASFGQVVVASSPEHSIGRPVAPFAPFFCSMESLSEASQTSLLEWSESS